MVGKRIEVEALEAHFGEQVEGDVGLPRDSIAHDEGVVEADAVEVAVSGEGVKPVEHDGHEAGTGEDFKDGVVSATGVLEAVLTAGPVEEFETGEDVGRIVAGAKVGEDLEDEGLGEAEVEAGECGVDVVVGVV